MPYIEKSERIAMTRKQPTQYTKKQFLEELEEAKKKGEVVGVQVLAMFTDLRLANVRCGMDKLDELLEKLDDDMMFVNEHSDFLAVLAARFNYTERFLRFE